MGTIVSTKILTQAQKALLKDFNLLVYNAITIEEIDFEGSISSIKNAIVTSQNAAQLIINKNIAVENVFCVGLKTKQLLIENDYTVIIAANNALELANVIVENYKTSAFTFFCGDKRRNELPNTLSKNNVSFQEQMVYKTVLQPKKVEKKVDGVLFFSPSGVESYTLKNDLNDVTAFCIGKTTAAAAKKYTDSIVIAKETTIESVLKSVVNNN